MVAKHPSSTRARLLRIWLALAPLLLCESVAAATVTFTKIADTSTAIPGGSGNFGHFGRLCQGLLIAPALQSGQSAFLGSSCRLKRRFSKAFLRSPLNVALGTFSPSGMGTRRADTHCVGCTGSVATRAIIAPQLLDRMRDNGRSPVVGP